MGNGEGSNNYVMKNILIFLAFALTVSTVFAQGGMATFKPIVPSTPQPMQSGFQNDVGELTKSTGYILDESGYVKSKIQIKVSSQITAFGESMRIVSYYNVVPGFGANWESVSVDAHSIGGQLPITQQQKVAYANFSYWASWGSEIIWFN